MNALQLIMEWFIMSHVFLRIKEVQKRTGKGKTTIYREIKEGQFPKQLRNGAGTVVWLESEILRWQEEKINKRENILTGDFRKK